jgi:hypothetical protein
MSSFSIDVVGTYLNTIAESIFLTLFTLYQKDVNKSEMSPCASHEGVRENGGIAPLTLNPGTECK